MLRRPLCVLSLCLTSLILVCALPALAEWDADGLEELLPHHETDAERLKWQDSEIPMPAREGREDPPPVAPLDHAPLTVAPSTGASLAS